MSHDRYLEAGETTPGPAWLIEMQATTTAAGLMTLDQIKEAAARRSCTIEFATELCARVKSPRFRDLEVNCTAVQSWLWRPSDLLMACSEAKRQPFFVPNFHDAKTTFANGLDEIKIATIIGADGCLPYMRRRVGTSVAGSPADVLKSLLNIERAMSPLGLLGRDGRFVRAVDALEIAGLMYRHFKVTGGHRMVTVGWLPLAYLDQGVPSLSMAEDDALSELALA
jgi:hypothetical protein